MSSVMITESSDCDENTSGFADVSVTTCARRIQSDETGIMAESIGRPCAAM